MYLIHGTWIPDETEDFVQRGDFYLWVESDAPTDRPSRAADRSIHPRHLAGPALEAFLGDKLGIRDGPSGKVAAALRPVYFRLPSAGGEPLPSFELRPYVDSEVPDEFELAGWQVCGYRVSNVVATLHDVYYVALHAADEFQLGTDFLFWHQLT